MQWLQQELKNTAKPRGEVVKPENLYHSGIIVDDFDKTLEWFTEVAGYEWTDVVSVDQVGVTPRR